MRDALVRQFVKAAEDPRVIFLTADHGHSVFDDHAKELGARVVNVGICEQAMIGYASGLARVGYLPIVYGLASFVPMRCLEQIKLDLCLSKKRVILIGDGAGVVYTNLGNSHQCGEDIAALRSIPNIRIYSPADQHELAACFSAATGYDGPSYIRIGKSGLGDTMGPPKTTDPRWLIRNKSEICYVAHGSMVKQAISLAEECAADMMSVPRIKPLEFQDVSDLTEYSRIIVIEEHSRHGGLYSAICEILSEHPGPRIVSRAMNDEFTKITGAHSIVLESRGLPAMAGG